MRDINLNQELKTETKELKKELGKMKDLFNSEQLEALDRKSVV